MQSIIKGGLIGTAVALILNIILFFAASAGGITIGLGEGSTFPEVPLFAVVLLTVVGGLGAIITLLILQRVTAKPVDVFLLIALVVGLLSMIPPYFSTETRGAFVVLGLMHVAAAFGIIWGILYGLRGSNAGK